MKLVWDAGRARGIGLHEAESRRDRDPAEAATEAGRADHLGVPFHFPARTTLATTPRAGGPERGPRTDPMPGQRRRKQRQRRHHERHRPENVPGRWEPLFESQEHAELRDFLRRLRTEGTAIDPAHIRIDTLCGRAARPTTYQVSVYVPDTSA
ncbi:hypothetical protein [Streptomyces yangpuensis]|uniref:hypothetical protein n=1 Tax=Streptomyces yangpuensis TaxID=1648182 RepID=UPI0035DF8D5D